MNNREGAYAEVRGSAVGEDAAGDVSEVTTLAPPPGLSPPYTIAPNWVAGVDVWTEYGGVGGEVPGEWPPANVAGAAREWNEAIRQNGYGASALEEPGAGAWVALVVLALYQAVRDGASVARCMLGLRALVSLATRLGRLEAELRAVRTLAAAPTGDFVDTASGPDGVFDLWLVNSAWRVTNAGRSVAWWTGGGYREALARLEMFAAGAQRGSIGNGDGARTVVDTGCACPGCTAGRAARKESVGGGHAAR